MNDPTVYRRGDTPYWWLSWFVEENGKSVRISKSLRKLGLRVDEVSEDEALRQAKVYLGVIDEAASPADYDLKAFRRYSLDHMEKKGLRSSTVRETRIALDHLVNFLGSSFLVRDVSRGHVADFQRYLLDNNQGPPTVNKICRQCRAAFGVLYDDEYLARNPFSKFRPLRYKPSGPRVLNREQVREVQAAALDVKGPLLYHLIQVSLYTAARRREVLAIRRSDIDFERERVLVHNSKASDHERRWIRPGKACMKSLRWFCEEGPRAGKDDPLAVCHRDTFTHWVLKVFRAVGLPESLHLHSLRHSWVTLAGEKGEVPLWRIQMHVGHKSIKTTEGYFHPDADLGEAIDPGY